MTRRYRHVDLMKAEHFPVNAACGAAGVSRAGYYEWKDRSERKSELEKIDRRLVSVIKSIDAEFDNTYGSPRMTHELRRRGYHLNHKRVERLMRVNGLVGVTPRARVRTTVRGKDAPGLSDLVERRFAPGAPDVAWAGDITYIATEEGWCYLASVLDLGSRRLIGWHLDAHMPAGLVTTALELRVHGLR